MHIDQTNSNETDPSGCHPVGDPSGSRPVGDPEWLERVPLAAWRGWICRGGSWDVGRSTAGRLRWAPVRSGAYVPCAMLRGHGLDVPDGVREVRARPIEVVEETCYSDASTRGYALGLREVAGILGLNTSGPSDGDDRAECDHWRREIRAHVETVSVRERRGVAQAILQRTLSAGDGALRTIETAGAGTIVAVAASAICRRQNEIRRRANVRGRLQGLREACTSFGIDPKRDADPETEIARCQTALGAHAEHVAENVLRDVAERAGLAGPDQTCADIDHCQSAAEHYRREIVSRVKSTYHYGDVLAQRRETACLLLERLGAGDAALMAQIRQATPGDVLRLASDALLQSEPQSVTAACAAARRNALVDACEILGIDTQRVRTADDAVAVLREMRRLRDAWGYREATVREVLSDLLRELGVEHDRDEIVNTETVASAISHCSQIVREWAKSRVEDARTSGAAAGAREVAVVALSSLGAYDDATRAALREAEGKGFPLVAAVLTTRFRDLVSQLRDDCDHHSRGVATDAKSALEHARRDSALKIVEDMGATEHVGGGASIFKNLTGNEIHAFAINAIRGHQSDLCRAAERRGYRQALRDACALLNIEAERDAANTSDDIVWCKDALRDFAIRHTRTDDAQAFDPVQKPAHYAAGKVECIDATEAALQGDTDPVSAFLRGQVIKYVWRMHGKGAPLQDAKKAAWYLERLIRHLDGEPEGGGGFDGGDKIQFNAPEERAAVSTAPEIMRAYDVWRETDDARTAIRAPNAGVAVEQYCSDAGLSSNDVDSNVEVRVQVPGHHTVGIYRVQNGVVQLVRTVRLARFRRVVQP